MIVAGVSGSPPHRYKRGHRGDLTRGTWQTQGRGPEAFKL